MANRIQLRRDGAQQWANINPILAQGELGIEIDTSRIKIGDGVTPWNSLRYERPLETESNAANTLVKRDADGNFQAGAITATVIGNAATATRLANARQIQLAGQVTGSGSFDGSSNLTLTTDLSLITTLPHYNPADPDASDLYTRVRVNSQGRVIGAELASTLANYGITDAQPLDDDLTSLAGLSTVGLLARVSQGNITTRQLTGGAGRIIFTVPDGSSQNPFIDLADTAVVVGSYNVESLTSVNAAGSNSEPYGTQTVNTTKFSVDRYGRITLAENVPIATAVEGSKYASYDAGTTYARYAIIANASKVYQAIQTISAGGGAPTHSTGDVNGWRYCAAEGTEQKGLASFAQEDFDVDANGHVTISAMGVDNTQLQNNKITFTDGNTVQDFELDNELTTSTAHTGFDYLNYVKVNSTSGGLLFSANNTDNSNAGGVDINVDTNISGAFIKLDRPGNTPLQTIERTAGSLKIHHNVSSSTDRTLDIISNNAGAGTASINITADEDITISSTNVSNRVNVEGFQFQDDTLSSTATTMILDPGDDDAATGKVQIRGDLQVDGTTTTVNSTVVTIDDPIMVLGGDTAPVADDNKDRGVEFSYYDTQARVGFYGWDENYADSNIWNGTGGFRFLYNATNTNEVFTGTDAALIAGNLRLTTNTGASSTTTGTLVVTGGLGLSENAHVGGTVTVAGQTEINNNVIFKADNKSFNIQTAAGVDKFTVDTDNGNTVIEGTLDVQLETTITDNVIIKADNKKFDIQTAAGVSVFDVDSDNGNTHTDGTLDVDSGVTFNSTLDVDQATTLNNILDVDGISTFHNDIILDTTGKTFKLNNGSADKFVVQSTSGNTDIEGSLNVASLIHFESSDTPTISTDGNNNYIITGSDYGALRLDGGGYIEGNTLFNSDIYINGQINQKDQGSSNETFNTQNFLRVRYKFRTGVTAAYTPSYAQDNSSNFRSFGGGGIATDLHIGDNLYVGKKANTDNIEFSVSPAGNVVAGRSGLGSASAGTITVHGDAVFNREFSITGAQTTIGDASGDALSVNATSTFNAPVTLSGSNDLEVGGNATVEGNLTVNGTTTTINTVTTQLDDPILTLGGDTAPNTDDNKDRGIEFRYYDGSAKLGFFGWDDSQSRFALYHNATNTSEVFGGTRSGIDAGSIKLFDTTNATSPSTGTLIVGGGAGIGLDLRVGDDLFVVDDADIGGNLNVTGTFDVGDDLAVANNKFNVDAVTGNTTVAGTLGVTQNTNLSTFTASGIATLQSTLNLGGSLNINNSKFTVASVSGNTDIAGTLDVTNAVDFDSTLNVDGNADFNSGIDVTSGNATFAGLVQADNVTDSTGYSDASASISTDGGLSVKKKAYVGGDFSVGGAAGIKASITAATGNTDIKGTLNVDDAVTFGGTLGVTGQITGDVTGDVTGNADTATQVAVTETNNNALFYPAFMGGNTGNQSVHVDSANLRYNPFSNTLSVTNFISTTNFEVQGNMNITGLITFGESEVGSIANHNTDALTEGSTNLYFTDERVDDRVNNLFTAGTGITKVYDDAANSYTLSVTQVDINTDNVTEGSTNLFTTAARTRTHFVYGTGIQLNTDTISVTQSDINTDNVTEGSTNLFTTNTRTRSHFTYGNGIALSAGGELTVTESQIDTDNVTEGSTNLFTTAARTRTHFTYGTGITHSSGTLSVTQADIDTDNVTEGSSNLFTTAARTRTHFTYGTGIKLTTADLAIDFTEFDTDNVSEGSTNLYFTNARADARIAAADTDDLSEGSTNLYYTNARADARVVAGITGKLDASAISTFGLTLVDDASASAARTTLGLGSAATTASSAYATAAQGTLAASATQPGDLATVATSGAYNDLTGKPTLFSGAYNDLTGKPTLGTAAATASTAYATAAQGTKADANDTDIDDIYTQLVAIGNNAAITTVAQLKTALLALARS